MQDRSRNILKHLTALAAVGAVVALFGYGATLREVEFAPTPGEPVKESS